MQIVVRNVEVTMLLYQIRGAVSDYVISELGWKSIV